MNYKWIFILFATVLFGCTDIDPVNSRLDRLEQEMARQRSEIEQIKEAWDDAKIITDIKQIEPDESNRFIGGWLITFSEGPSILINSSDNKSLVPYLRVNGDGFWTVSYDGENFEYILDENGNKVSPSGNNGNDGNNIRVTLSDDGYYYFEIYHSSDPETVIQSIETPYSSNPTSVISSIIRNDANGDIILTMMDGSIFTFALQKIVPTGIVILNTNPLILSKDRASVKFDFRINPSNVYFNYNTENPDCQIKLNFVRGIKALNNGNYPCLISEIVPAQNDAGNIIDGQYTVMIKDAGNNILAYNEGVYITLSYKDSNGDTAIITSNVFTLKYDSEYPFLNYTGLPVVIINIPDGKEITSKTVWTPDVEMSIYDENGELDYEGTLQMKGRGNTTWQYPKKPYALKLDVKSKILGMAKHKRWCLLANYIDRTLIRNAVAFEISKTIGMEYTPSGKFVELIVNGKHKGNYYLTEQIKIDKNRVDITELDENATEGDRITGGYIFELDTNYDEVYKFKSPVFNFPWMFKDPDEVNEAQFNYIKNYVTEMETAIKKIPISSEFENYIDSETFAKWWIVYELTSNSEPYAPKSVYLYKDINSKIKAGPVWDFDWLTFIPDRSNSFVISNALYYGYLIKDTHYRNILKACWYEYKNKSDKVIDFIDNNKILNKKSDVSNYKLWGCPWITNGDNTLPFENAIDRLKQSYIAKYNWLDSYINSL